MNEEIKAILQPYRGNYIKEMRKTVGHAPLMVTACNVIIENAKGEILLQQRSDNGKWGIPGGAMEMGESFIDAAKREVFEEVGIAVDNLSLFGIYSGEERILVYPNDDICCYTSIVFKTTGYEGEVLQSTEEALQHVFFSAENLPENISITAQQYIDDWKRKVSEVIVD